MKYEDADLVEALVALETTIPDGAFTEFSRKVSARMEGESMQRSNQFEPVATGGMPPVAPAPRDENSGLHEIQELAGAAKKRASQRLSSQSDAEELQSQSGAFKLVVLPDPTKQAAPHTTAQMLATPAMPAPSVAMSGPMPSFEATVTAGAPRRGMSAGLIAALAVTAVAAGVGLFLYLGPLSNKNEQTAALPPEAARAEAVPEVAPAPAPVAAPTARPLEEAAVAAADGQPGQPAETAAGAMPGESDLPPASKEAAAAPARAASEHESRKDEAKEDKKAAVAQAAEPTEKPVKAKVEKASLDDVLDGVTGGVEETEKAEKAPAAPTKAGLDRGDVADAMATISDRARACQETEGAVGSVNIKFTVDPSGRVSKASATGKFAGTATGACVAAAVKSAKFPAWNGGPMSFSYPFLLSQ